MRETRDEVIKASQGGSGERSPMTCWEDIETYVKRRRGGGGTQIFILTSIARARGTTKTKRNEPGQDERGKDSIPRCIIYHAGT